MFSHTFYKGSDEELSQDEEAYRNFIRQRNADYEGLIKQRETNSKFARDNDEFKKACERAEVSPTVRQASKYRRERGKAYAS